MSEPVIKAVMRICIRCMCHPCRHTVECDLATDRLYDRDAIVDAVVYALDLKGESKRAARKRACAIVDRLTKGDV